MKTLAVIAFEQSQFDERLKRMLDETGIDPDEFEDLEFFGLIPFFVLAGASVRTEAHGHDDHLHFASATVEIPEDLEPAFFAVLPGLLDQAYADAEEEEEEEA